MGGRLTREDLEKHLASAGKDLLRQRLLRRRNRLWLRVMKNVSDDSPA
ncbi:hypothetical protein ACNKHU_03505 [Shigella flexneri]